MDKDTQWFCQNARQLHIDLSDTQLAQFDLYKNELLAWNAKTNLISENSSRKIMARHFLDSLTARQFIVKPDATIIDIGSGAGFPGLPLKIVMPEAKIYLLESNRKKVSFLKHVIRLLKLSGAEVVHDRVENIIQSDTFNEKFDILISRATFKLSELIRLGHFFLVPEGQLIALKGPKVDEEIKPCASVTNRHKISQLIQYDIQADFLDASRKIIIGKK